MNVNSSALDCYVTFHPKVEHCITFPGEESFWSMIVLVWSNVWSFLSGWLWSTKSFTLSLTSASNWTTSILIPEFVTLIFPCIFLFYNFPFFLNRFLFTTECPLIYILHAEEKNIWRWFQSPLSNYSNGSNWKFLPTDCFSKILLNHFVNRICYLTFTDDELTNGSDVTGACAESAFKQCVYKEDVMVSGVNDMIVNSDRFSSGINPICQCLCRHLKI